MEKMERLFQELERLTEKANRTQELRAFASEIVTELENELETQLKFKLGAREGESEPFYLRWEVGIASFEVAAKVIIRPAKEAILKDWVPEYGEIPIRPVTITSQAFENILLYPQKVREQQWECGCWYLAAANQIGFSKEGNFVAYIEFLGEEAELNGWTCPEHSDC